MSGSYGGCWCVVYFRFLHCHSWRRLVLEKERMDIGIGFQNANNQVNNVNAPPLNWNTYRRATSYNNNYGASNDS